MGFWSVLTNVANLKKHCFLNPVQHANVEVGTKKSAKRLKNSWTVSYCGLNFLSIGRGLERPYERG